MGKSPQWTDDFKRSLKSFDLNKLEDVVNRYTYQSNVLTKGAAIFSLNNLKDGDNPVPYSDINPFDFTFDIQMPKGFMDFTSNFRDLSENSNPQGSSVAYLGNIMNNPTDNAIPDKGNMMNLNALRINWFSTSIIDVNNEDNTVLNVNGMTCSHCEESVQKTLLNIKGVENVIADSKLGKVTYSSNGNNEKEIMKAIIDLGFNIKND